MSDFDYDEWISHIKEVPEDKLISLNLEISAERRRRAAEPAVKAALESVAEDYHKTAGSLVTKVPQVATLEELIAAVPEWKKPAGAFDAWPNGAIVHDGGIVWQNRSGVALALQPTSPENDARYWNVITPPLAPQPSQDETPAVPEWKAGEHVEVGMQRTFEGATYTVLQPHDTQAGWTPAATPALWSKDEANDQ